jgi:prevent-host-death family protein
MPRPGEGPKGECYTCSIVENNGREIPQRELRNHIGRVLREVAAGARLRVTVRGRPVADLTPVGTDRRFVPRSEIEDIVRNAPLDRRFTKDVGATLAATIEEL